MSAAPAGLEGRLLSVDRSWAAAQPRAPRPGAFDWWYVDGRDEAGDGLVFIWASRLPFFDDDRPAINVALYRRGRQAFWLLQQPDRDGWRSEPGAHGFRVALGASALELSLERGVLALRAELDLPLPGERRRLRGAVEASGPSAVAREAAPSAAAHRWVPLAPAARVRARLSLDRDPLFSFDGPGYADRNLGDAPLGELGLARWSWGRAREGDGCTAWYALEGKDGAREGVRLDAGAAGVALQPAGWEESGGRLRLGGLSIDPGRAVERGPFYRRSFGALGGRGVPAVHERCEVARLEARWHRPFVRMRLHRPAGGNSLWAPLFTGTSEGRVRRLLRGVWA